MPKRMIRRVLVLGLALSCAPVRGQDAPAKKPSPTRYRFDVLYTIHKRLGKLERDRILALVLKAWPKFDVAKLEPLAKDMKEYFGLYSVRLTEERGVADRIVGPTSTERWLKAFAEVRPQVQRELELRALYWWFHGEAKRLGGLKLVFARLQKHDDKKQPVCSTQAGKALIVFRDFGEQPLTGNELADLEDGDVRFTRNFRSRVTMLADGAPRLSPKPVMLGSDGHGRCLVHLLAVERK